MESSGYRILEINIFGDACEDPRIQFGFHHIPKVNAEVTLKVWID